MKAGKRLSDIDVYAIIVTNGSSREAVATELAAATSEFVGTHKDVSRIVNVLNLAKNHPNS